MNFIGDATMMLVPRDFFYGRVMFRGGGQIIVFGEVNVTGGRPAAAKKGLHPPNLALTLSYHK